MTLTPMPVRIGIVGCGMIANFHAHAINNTDGAVLAGACSKSPASAEKFCTEQNIPKFDSYAQMLGSADIDAVSLCTPSGDHCRQILQALEAGKHVVVEKPMCITLEECDRVIAKAEETGLTVCVISQHRFSDGISEIRRAIGAGELGKIHCAQLTMHYFRPQSYYDSAAWRGTWALDGGGVLMNQGIHGVDMLCYLLGRAQSVTGFVTTSGRDIEVEDTAAAALEFESGAVATLDATVCSQPSFSKKFILCGEKGTVVMEEDAILSWSLPDPCPIPLGAKSGNSASADPKGISVAYHLREYENFVGHVLDGKELMLDADQGRMPLSVILGVYESSRTGTHIKL